ncbi:MAG: tRNA 2-thiouridine(34) synthase MnmA [Pseudomonadota bacterium]|nr:tRNA 2-thiouridine(34) synthase MnmA [Pseudomonadota bacterium]
MEEKIDLGLPGANWENRVVVAMSGGVDSSVTAALVAEAGYEVVGITLQLYDHGSAIQRKGACCAGADIHDARLVAEKIGIPHYVLDYESKFKESVMEDFADSYARGETPIPCIRCNQTVKFRDLLQTAKQLGAKALCTGHYVQRAMGKTGVELRKGVDQKKDQSYFLFATTSDQLEYLRFPLGGLTKDETRRHANRIGLNVADKPDSQDICFVPNGKYADVVSRLRPDAIEPGEIVDMDGAVIGKHDGIVNFTVGQRKGLGIGGRSSLVGPGATDPLYVVAVNSEERRVVVGPHSALGRNLLKVSEINWLGDNPISSSGEKLMIKLRSTQEPISGTLFSDGSDNGKVVLDELEFGVAIGQAAVFYSRDDSARVLGGGWMTETSLH